MAPATHALKGNGHCKDESKDERNGESNDESNGERNNESKDEKSLC